LYKHYLNVKERKIEISVFDINSHVILQRLIYICMVERPIGRIFSSILTIEQEEMSPNQV
jgi:hypothetical protein